jgi:hypothetical protein
MGIKTGWHLLGLLSLAVCGLGRADTLPAARATVEAAILDPRRPDDQVKLDATRKPEVSVLFSEAKRPHCGRDVRQRLLYENPEPGSRSDGPCLRLHTNRADRALLAAGNRRHTGDCARFELPERNPAHRFTR